MRLPTIAIALPLVLVAFSVAAQNTAGSTSGPTTALPGAPQTGLGADQASARVLIGQDVSPPDGGNAFAEVETVYLDRASGDVAGLGLKMASGDHRPLISITDIRVADQPLPHVTTAVPVESLARAPVTDREALATKIDVRQGLFDRPVQARGGQVVGRAHDMIVGYGGGQPKALVVLLDKPGALGRQQAVAVPWREVTLGAPQQPIVLALDAQAIGALPELGSIAPHGQAGETAK